MYMSYQSKLLIYFLNPFSCDWLWHLYNLWVIIWFIYNANLYKRISIRPMFSQSINLSEPSVRYAVKSAWSFLVNSSPSGENGPLFADDMFKRIFFNVNIWISNKISLEYIPRGLIDNMSVLVQIMAWPVQVPSHYLNQCWPSSPMHICSTRGRWVKQHTCKSVSTWQYQDWWCHGTLPFQDIFY